MVLHSKICTFSFYFIGFDSKLVTSQIWFCFHIIWLCVCCKRSSGIEWDDLLENHKFNSIQIYGLSTFFPHKNQITWWNMITRRSKIMHRRKNMLRMKEIQIIEDKFKCEMSNLNIFHFGVMLLTPTMNTPSNFLFSFDPSRIRLFLIPINWHCIYLK